MNPPYQTSAWKFVESGSIRQLVEQPSVRSFQTRARVPVAEETPTTLSAKSDSHPGRTDADAAPAHGQQGKTLVRDDASRRGADCVNGSIGLDSAADDSHSNRFDTWLPCANVRDASSNRECCGAALRSASRHAQNGSRRRTCRWRTSDTMEFPPRQSSTQDQLELESIRIGKR